MRKVGLIFSFSLALAAPSLGAGLGTTQAAGASPGVDTLRTEATRESAVTRVWYRCGPRWCGGVHPRYYGWRPVYYGWRGPYHGCRVICGPYRCARVCA
jgi:hypothetical protein